ncbi:MAG: hypothetical protein AAGJ35_07100, partial [Myxococcota bacterium]
MSRTPSTTPIPLPEPIHPNTYWWRWLQHSHYAPSKILKEFLRHAPCPAHLLRHFACDCLERQLLLATRQGVHIDPRVYTLLAHVRQTIESSDIPLRTPQHLYWLLDALEEPQPTFSKQRRILILCDQLLDPDPRLAALAPCLYSLHPKDHPWQRQHLQHLLHQYHTQLQKLL